MGETYEQKYPSEMKEAYEKIPSRSKQLDELYGLFGETDEPLLPFLFISGDTNTGKSFCVETVLRLKNYQYAVINCIECNSPNLIYEDIIYKLKEDQALDITCNSLLNLADHLKNKQCDNPFQPIVIILDYAERLCSTDHNTMNGLLHLRDLTNLNICIVIITRMSYSKFPNLDKPPIKLYFPTYSKEDLGFIFSQHRIHFVEYVLTKLHSKCKSRIKEIENEEFFMTFLNIFLNISYHAYHDLIELKEKVQENFLKYCEYTLDSEVDTNDTSAFWRQMQYTLKNSSDQPLVQDQTMTSRTLHTFDSMPLHTKYLLIATYLASYNPEKIDKRLFMKNHGKKRKTVQDIQSKAKTSEKYYTQRGPKVFNFNRLLAIYQAIIGQPVLITNKILQQIPTLVRFGLLAGNTEFDLDCPQYKCLVGFDGICEIAKSINFDIKKYLFDFI